MPNIQINDANYYYELHGSGQPVILISGYTRDSTAWLPLLNKLCNYFQVLIFDNRGVGRTKDNGNALTIDLMAHDVMLLADQLSLKNPHIVGQSMGGNIAQVIASNYQNDISKLAIVVSSAKWRKAMLAALKNSLGMREKNIELDVIIDTVMPWVFGENFLNDPKTIENYKNLVRNYPYPQSIEDQARQFKALEQFDGRNSLPQISAPTIVIHGKQDVMSLSYEAKFLASEIKNAKFIELDCAHGMIVEKSQALTDTLIEFFIN